MTFTTSRKIFSIVLVILIYAGSVVNILAMKGSFTADFKGLIWPDSLAAIRAAIDRVEKSVNTNIASKTKFIEVYAYIHVLLAKKEMSDFGQVKSETGSLNHGNVFPVDTSQARKYARRAAWLKRAAEVGGARMLFLAPLHLVVKGHTRFEKGLPFQDLNILQDAFLHHLRQYGVDYLDIRYSLLDNEELPPDQYVYKTDHHWTVEACFEVFRDLVQELNSRFNAGLDPDGFYRDKANYLSQNYPFLGSLGRTTGIIYSGLEYLALIQPSFDSDYTVEMIDFTNRYATRRGPAEKSLFHASSLTIHNPYVMDPYRFYLLSVTPWIKIVNHKNPGGPRLLLVRDSYSSPLACFLAPLFSEIHMIWPVANNPVQVEPYLAETRFDYVVLELYPGNISEAGMGFFLEADDEGLITR